MFLSRDQRRRAVAAAVEAVASIPIIVGVGAMRTDEAQALARDAAEEGASGLLLAPVSYTPLTEEEAAAQVEGVELRIDPNAAEGEESENPSAVAAQVAAAAALLGDCVMPYASNPTVADTFL